METEFRGDGAIFSEDRLHRYLLWRDLVPLQSPRKILNYIALNPSTADEFFNDPAVTRLKRRTLMTGHHTLVVTNLFAWRSTDPKELYEVPDPVGIDNDCYIVSAAMNSDTVVCAWGKHGALLDRGQRVKRLLDKAMVSLTVLKLTKDGTPWHPLYLPMALEPKPWEALCV